MYSLLRLGSLQEKNVHTITIQSFLLTLTYSILLGSFSTTSLIHLRRQYIH